MGWANKLIGWTSGNGQEVNADGAALATSIPPSGSYYVVGSKTGTIAAAAAGGAAVYAMRVNPGYSGKVYVDRIILRWTTVAAFTTPITAGRSIVITRGAGAASSGGTSLATATKKDSTYAISQTDVSAGGDVRIATTGALTVTSITFESVNLAEFPLSHVGAAGGYAEFTYDMTSTRGHPIELNPGELLAVRVGSAAMDAAGTWQLGVEVQWRESTSEG